MKETLFMGFGIFTLAMGFGVVFSRSAVYSALCLILSFFGLSALYVVWNATFVAMVQILIYTGAIVVLFVFVVMLLNLGSAKTGAQFHRVSTVLVAAVGSWCLSLLLLRTLDFAPFFSGSEVRTFSTDLRSISKLLFNEYLWPFEVLSVFLLVMIVAIFALARPEHGESP